MKAPAGCRRFTPTPSPSPVEGEGSSEESLRDFHIKAVPHSEKRAASAALFSWVQAATAADEFGEGVGCQGAAVQVALGVVTTLRLQEGELCFGFHAFGEYL